MHFIICFCVFGNTIKYKQHEKIATFSSHVSFFIFNGSFLQSSCNQLKENETFPCLVPKYCFHFGQLLEGKCLATNAKEREWGRKTSASTLKSLPQPLAREAVMATPSLLLSTSSHLPSFLGTRLFRFNSNCICVAHESTQYSLVQQALFFKL